MDIFFAELIGTMFLVLLGNGVVANVLLRGSKGHDGGWIVVTSGWAFAVTVSVYLVGWISGGHLNPAVTLGLCLAGKASYSMIPIYVSGQIIGAMLGAFFTWVSYKPHWAATADPMKKLLCFSTMPAIRSLLWNFLAEVIGTAVLLMGVLGILNPNNGISSGVGPLAVGLLIFSIGLSLGGPTGYAINPARDLGPRIVHFFLPIKGKGSSGWWYSWVPVLGPLTGGALGGFLYQLLFSDVAPFKGFIR